MGLLHPWLYFISSFSIMCYRFVNKLRSNVRIASLWVITWHECHWYECTCSLYRNQSQPFFFFWWCCLDLHKILEIMFTVFNFVVATFWHLKLIKSSMFSNSCLNTWVGWAAMFHHASLSTYMSLGKGQNNNGTNQQHSWLPAARIQK